MGAGYDGHVIIWDVSCFTEIPGTTSLIFLDNKTEYVCSLKTGTDVAILLDDVGRFGRGIQSKCMILENITWLMATFLRKY